MTRFSLTRPQFVVAIVVVLGLKLAAILASGAINLPASIDAGLAGAVIVCIAARFRDAGKPAWLGVVLSVLSAIVLPVALVFAYRPDPDTFRDDPFAAMPFLWVPTVCFFLLIVAATLLKSRPRSGDTNSSRALKSSP